MSEYKFSNFFQKIMIFQHFLQIFEKIATSPKRHLKFFWIFKAKILKKTGVAWFGVSTTPPLFSTAGRRTTYKKLGRPSYGTLLYYGSNHILYSYRSIGDWPFSLVYN